MPQRTIRRLRPALAAAILISAFGGTAGAASRTKKPQSRPGNFAYYLLSLSWAPEFCAQSNVPKDPRECGKGRHAGFVVHGLWPRAERSRGPEGCAAASPAPEAVIRAMLSYIPTETLIRHEWATHGACSGLSAADYFAAVRKARDLVNMPEEFTAPGRRRRLSPSEIEAKFAAANPAFPGSAFRVTCRNGALQELRICYGKDLSPRACGPSAGACRLPSVTVRAVQ